MLGQNTLGIALLGGLLLLIGLVLGAFLRGRAERAGRGLTSRRRRQILLEDALKHLHDTEYRGIGASVDSVAGALGISAARAAQIVALLEADRFLEREGDALRLTEAGRLDARRVLRTHRLWERYLAEETGVGETEWHARAEKREHDMSPEEVEMLAARMGNPAFDPHGDPIPSASGELPPHRGVPLPSLQPGEGATILHLEDEPEALYAQLVEQDLHPGMEIRVVRSTPKSLELVSERGEHALSPVAAANVTVKTSRGLATEGDDTFSLDALQTGEAAEVLGILPGCFGSQRRRLLDLGLVPGTHVVAEMESASGDPTAYRIRGSLLALREDQARWIRVTRRPMVNANDTASEQAH